MKTMLSYLLFLGLSILQLHSPLAVADSRKSYTLAVVPQFTSTQVYRDWKPLLAQLKRSTGIHSESVQSQLKVIFSTPEIASHPLAAHPRVSTEASQKIVTALIEMSANPETGKLLGAIQIPKPVEANFQRDYSGLVKLRLEHYSVAESK